MPSSRLNPDRNSAGPCWDKATMRILYMTRSDSTHDQRFMTALAESGHDGFVLRLRNGKFDSPRGVTPLQWQGIDGPLQLRQVSALRQQLRDILKDLRPDLIHAGPIHDVAYLVARDRFVPLLTMSWGFDLMKDARSNLLNTQRTHYTLQHSQGLIVDCQSSAEVAKRFGFPLFAQVINGIFQYSTIAMIVFWRNENEGIALSDLISPLLLFRLIIDPGSRRVGACKKW